MTTNIDVCKQQPDLADKQYMSLSNMEAYPQEYIEHNLPLVILSGLGGRSNETSLGSSLPNKSGTRLQSASPECNGERAHALLSEFLKLDGSSQPWNATSLPNSSGMMKYRMKTIGRVGMASADSVTQLYLTAKLTK